MPTSVKYRPTSSTGDYNGLDEYENHEAKLSDTYVAAPGFKKHLEKFYQKASPADQRRCLDLLSAINLGESVRDQEKREKPIRTPTFGYGHNPAFYYKHRRPKTAMADLCRATENQVPLGPYVTSYKREYPEKPAPSAAAERPMTSNAFQASYDLNGPIGGTTYQNEYYDKDQKTAQPFRTGSASGNRRNNPHPLEAFMVWKLPQRPQGENPTSEWSGELTDDMMDKVCRGKLMSTYQQDYLGIPQGFQVASAYDDKADWKSKVPYTLDSSTRHTYQKPEVTGELKGNNSRYGCNKTKHVPANGVVPTTSKRHLDINTRTTYEREYVQPGVTHTRPTRVRTPHVYPYGMALQPTMDSASDTDKQMLQEMLQSVGGVRPPSVRPPSSTSYRSSRLRATPLYPPTGCLKGTTPDWMDTYVGPALETPY